jgi:integrase
LTWRTLIGLLAATGMRPGEACHLTLSDIDLTNGVIQLLQTKFGKSRLVFIHPTTATMVARYLQARQEWVGTAARACPAVFVNSRHRALNPDALGVTFKQIVAAAGLTTEPGRRPARLHDLRHTFAVTTKVRGIAFDASLGVVGDREPVRDFGFGAAGEPAWRYGRHAI